MFLAKQIEASAMK